MVMAASVIVAPVVQTSSRIRIWQLFRSKVVATEKIPFRFWRRSSMVRFVCVLCDLVAFKKFPISIPVISDMPSDMICA